MWNLFISTICAYTFHTLGDHTNAKRDAVLLNAAMGVYVYGLADSIESAFAIAKETLASGKAIETLDTWIKTTQALE
jgi:anthranilate phosphoribosyltransferase